MSNEWISDYLKPDDFEELTLDELREAQHEAKRVGDHSYALAMYTAWRRRLAIKHALLDLAEDLSEQGLVVVPREASFEMAEAGEIEFYYAEGLLVRNAARAWEAMIDAAPPALETGK